MDSHDRTLLARLGFQDPDGENALHERACQYLAEPEQARKIVETFAAAEVDPTRELTTWEWCKAHRADEHLAFRRTESRIQNTWPAVEKVISTGVGEHQTTVGSLDVRIGYVYEAHEVGKGKILRGKDRGVYPFDRWTAVSGGEVCVEVKIARVPASDILRQINLYREYVRPPVGGMTWRPVQTRWVAAVAFDLSNIEIGLLRCQRVEVVRLGERFERWAESHTGAASLPEL
jgi:hypothetical protein